ncbi:MAG: copper-binding protein [Burkholderiaceae bacterium]
MNSFSKLAIGAAIAFSAASMAFAQGAEHDAHHPAPSPAAPASSGSVDTLGGEEGEMTDGEIRKVDKGAGKITIRHGELKNLGMPPMTMVFRVKEPEMLDQVKAGDKVKFIAEKVGGALTLVKLQNAS